MAPDSFKGGPDAAEVARALASGWREIRPADDVRLAPMADGGEGTLQVLAHSEPDAQWHSCPVQGPDGRPVTADWLLLPDGTAVVELARAVGLPLMQTLSAGTASTYGLGQLLAAATEDPGTRQILVTLGGSATTDGGGGALAALGARLLDAGGRDLGRGGLALAGIASVDLTGLLPPPAGGVVCLVDVSAPLVGPLGAAHQFGPQKGADADLVDRLEAALTRWAEILPGDPRAPGAGAAGGTTYGLVAGWGATARPGAPALAELSGLTAGLAEADLVVTGEGRFDAQSLRGKVVGHVLEQADERGVSAAVVAGAVEDPPAGSWQLLSLSRLAGSAAASLADPTRWMTEAGRQLARAYG